jgi:hypothetical protein
VARPPKPTERADDPLAGFRRLFDISSKSLRNLPLMHGGSSLGASMGWWFGRKSAPADARPFVPAWLQSDAAEEGFARSVEGISAYVKATGTWASYRSGAWELGVLRGDSVMVGGLQVVGNRFAAIPGPSGGTIVDAEARGAIDQILAALQHHGLIDS